MTEATPEDDGIDVVDTEMYRYFMDEVLPYRSVLLAIGHTVLAAARLEKVLGTSLSHRKITAVQGDRTGLVDEMLRIQRRTGGRLLNELRSQGIPTEVADRIAEVIGRRNELVHHALNDPYTLAALSRGEGAPEVVARILTIAQDCDRLARELEADALDGLEAATGKTIPELFRQLEEFDASKIADPERRAMVEAFQLQRRINPLSHFVEGRRNTTSDDGHPGGEIAAGDGEVSGDEGLTR